MSEPSVRAPLLSCRSSRNGCRRRMSLAEHVTLRRSSSKARRVESQVVARPRCGPEVPRGHVVGVLAHDEQVPAQLVVSNQPGSVCTRTAGGEQDHQLGSSRESRRATSSMRVVTAGGRTPPSPPRYSGSAGGSRSDNTPSMSNTTAVRARPGPPPPPIVPVAAETAPLVLSGTPVARLRISSTPTGRPGWWCRPGRGKYVRSRPHDLAAAGLGRSGTKITIFVAVGPIFLATCGATSWLGEAVWSPFRMT